jgi:hypothetical protein
LVVRLYNEVDRLHDLRVQLMFELDPAETDSG